VTGARPRELSERRDEEALGVEVGLIGLEAR